MNIYISSDHGGFNLKNKILENEFLKKYNFIDLGPTELDEEDDYPDYAIKTCKKVLEDKNSVGILICRSGIGMCITANKFKGIYAALAFNETHAEMARKHNNANILCLDADYSDEELHFKIIEKFLNTEFEGWESRHGRRVNKIKELE
jgi:ribose 5-phosphate isomerase B